jgi:hypothetical protein
VAAGVAQPHPRAAKQGQSTCQIMPMNKIALRFLRWVRFLDDFQKTPQNGRKFIRQETV